MNFDNPMDYRDVSIFDFEYYDFSSTNGICLSVCEKQEVTAEEGRLHATTAQCIRNTIIRVWNTPTLYTLGHYLYSGACVTWIMNVGYFNPLQIFSFSRVNLAN